MGSIPNGPVIVFRVDSSQVAPALDQALNEVRSKSKSATDKIADDWRRTAAQIRAAVATGALSEGDVSKLRQQSVTSLSKEIELLRTRSDLTTKQLASLKAMTLEYERQKSFLKGTGGITTGTANALGQVSTQTTLGIERMVDSLVNRYLGGTAGAFTRTIRDISYYQNQASGGSLGFFGGLKTAASGLASSINPATIAVTGLVAALTAEAAILASVTDKMFKYAQTVENTAAATGLSLQQVQQYTQLSKNLDIDAGSITTAFARMNVQLGEIVTKGKQAGSENQALARVMKELGVSAVDANGQLRPVNAILSDMSDAFNKIGNSSQRTAVELEAFGTRGRVLAQIIEDARNSGESLKDILDQVSKVSLPDAEIQQLAREKAAWDKLTDSIDAAKIKLEGWIATHLKAIAAGTAGGVAGTSGIVAGVALGNLIHTPGAPSGPNAPTLTNAFALFTAESEARAAKTNADLLKRAEIIKAGGAAQYELNQAEKNYAQAIKDSAGADAERYAQEIKNLQTIISLDQQREQIWKRISEQLLRPGHPTLAKRSKSANAPPDIGNPVTGSASDILASIIGSPSSSTIVDQIAKEHDDLFTTQAQRDKQHYTEELDALNFALANKLISQEKYNEASLQLSQNWAKTQQDLNKKYVEDADKLFDDLISGNSQSFAKSLEKEIENIVTQPIRKQFDALISQLLGGLNNAINGTGTAATGAPGTATSTGIGTIGLGGSFGAIIKNIFGGASHATGAPIGLSTQNLSVTAANVYVIGGIGGGSALGLGSNFFGNNNPFAGGGVFFGNNSPLAGINAGFGGLKIPGIGGSAIGLELNPNLAMLLGGLLIGGIGAKGGNVTSEAMGAAAAATSIAGVLTATKRIPAAIGTKLPGIFGGAGMIASGIATGGVGGAFSDIAGGADIGLAFGPVGAAVGAGIGGLIALGNAIFGSRGWSHNVAQAMNRQGIYLPPSENFSFASNGSIASTLGTSFSTSGSREYKYGINAPFYANAIYGPLTNAQKLELAQQEFGLNPNSPFLNGNGNNLFTGVQPRGYRGYPTVPMPYIGNGPLGFSPSSRPAVNVNLNLPGYVDGQSAQAALGPHLQWIAQHVSAAVHSTSSGFANSVRRAVSLP